MSWCSTEGAGMVIPLYLMYSTSDNTPAPFSYMWGIPNSLVHNILVLHFLVFHGFRYTVAFLFLIHIQLLDQMNPPGKVSSRISLTFLLTYHIFLLHTIYHLCINCFGDSVAFWKDSGDHAIRIVLSV